MSDKSVTTTTTKSPVPRKLDDAMITALSSLISKGNYFHDAAALCNISDFTFYNWIKLAKQDEEQGLSEEQSVYIRLSNAIKKARAEARANMVEVIREAAVVKREWLPAITFLERTDPAGWGRKDRIQPEEKGEKSPTFVFILPDGTKLKPGELLSQADEPVNGEYKELSEADVDNNAT